MDGQKRLEGFKADLKREMEERVYLADRHDGSHALWSELTVEDKLERIAKNGVYYDLATEQFIDAASAVLGKAEAREAALRLLFEKAQELHRLDRMLPDDGGTEATPLVDRLNEILEAAREPLAADHERGEDGRGGR